MPHYVKLWDHELLKKVSEKKKITSINRLGIYIIELLELRISLWEKSKISMGISTPDFHILQLTVTLVLRLGYFGPRSTGFRKCQW